MQQILLNLLSNALKFTFEGIITINCSMIEDEGKWSLQISVTDSGVGISDEDQKKLF